MAKDKLHDNVREALINDGWIVTAEQVRLDLGETYVEVDLFAEDMLVAERGETRIAVEVKSFLFQSIIHAFHEALGQYLNYRSALAEADPERMVYLAIPVHAYNHEVFQGRFIQKRLREETAKLLIFDPNNNIIVQWIN